MVAAAAAGAPPAMTPGHYQPGSVGTTSDSTTNPFQREWNAIEDMEEDGQAVQMMERIRVVQTPEGGAMEILRTYTKSESRPDYEEGQESREDPRWVYVEQAIQAIMQIQQANEALRHATAATFEAVLRDIRSHQGYLGHLQEACNKSTSAWEEMAIQYPALVQKVSEVVGDIKGVRAWSGTHVKAVTDEFQSVNDKIKEVEKEARERKALDVATNDDLRMRVEDLE